MPRITFAQAQKFLDNITKEDRVAIIHHDDSDGFCSGIIYYDWCKSQKARVKQFTYKINKTQLKNLNLKKFNKIIICDLSSAFMGKELELIKDKKVFYTDHHPKHPIPEEIFELQTSYRGYIPSSRTAYELTGMKPWLALIGTISDSGNLYRENIKFINNHLNQLNTTLKEFKKNATNIVTNFLIYFDKNDKKAFGILEKIKSLERIYKLKKYSKPVEKEIQKFVENYKENKEKIGNINFYFLNPHFSIKGAVIGIISHNRSREAYIFYSPKDEYITLSARTNNRKINTLKIMEAGIKNLEFGNIGGHPAASGGMILLKDLEKFKENIKNFLKSKSKTHSK